MKKSALKIISHYVLSAAGVTLILLIVNFSFLAAWVVQSGKIYSSKNYSIEIIAESLINNGDSYSLPVSQEKNIEKHFKWAMFLDNGGNVVWSKNLPSEIPLKYNVSEVAGFSRWYLKDYPVSVWRRHDGLFVLGREKGSIWKYKTEMPQKIMDKALIWILALLIINAAVAVLLALLFGVRFFRSLKPILRSIGDMAEKKPVELPVKGIFGDISEKINKTSARLTQQEAKLNKRDTARTRWIAGISHDIRTPLSIVMGYSSELENDCSLPPAERRQALTIRKQSEKIKSLINDLNLASKLEYDMQPLKFKNISPAALLRSAAAEFLNSGTNVQCSISVTVEPEAQNTFITADEKLLKRAVSNLISNSIIHNPEGCEIRLSLKKDSGNCYICVSDNGTGFSDSVLKNLNKPITEELDSHGLGLTIVRQIAKVHKGAAFFRNMPERGCEAVICFPLCLNKTGHNPD